MRSQNNRLTIKGTSLTCSQKWGLCRIPTNKIYRSQQNINLSINGIIVFGLQKRKIISREKPILIIFEFSVPPFGQCLLTNFQLPSTHLHTPPIKTLHGDHLKF